MARPGTLDADTCAATEKEPLPPSAEPTWQKRGRLRALRVACATLKAEIDADEAERRRGTLNHLSEPQKAVLRVLARSYCDEVDWHAFSFKGLAGEETELDRDGVRRACRALARLGFAKHEINLWTEDGEMVGAGYRATGLGARYLGFTAAREHSSPRLVEPPIRDDVDPHPDPQKSRSPNPCKMEEGS